MININFKKGEVVFLTKAEVNNAIRWGTQRYNIDMEMSIKDRKVADRSSVEINCEGIAGEIAFFKLANKPLRISLIPRSSFSNKDKGDIFLDGVGWIDIKTVPKHDRDMKIPYYKKNNINGADWYVLMTGEKRKGDIIPSAFVYRGAIPSKIVFLEENFNDGAKLPCYQIPQNKLKDFGEWNEY